MVVDKTTVRGRHIANLSISVRDRVRDNQWRKDCLLC